MEGDANGDFDRFYGTLTDVTERAQLAAAARDNEAEPRALVDTMPVLAWIANPDGSIDWFNARWYEFTGTQPADQLSLGWKSVLDPNEVDRIVEHHRNALASGESW